MNKNIDRTITRSLRRMSLIFFVGIFVTAQAQEATAPISKEKPLMKNFMGINGHLHFKPELYSPATKQARNYHPIIWDLQGTVGGKIDTSRPMDTFPLSRQVFTDKETKADYTVDWSKVYGSWKAAGYEIDSCLQFEGIKFNEWKSLEKDAEAYGKAFAAAFGPSSPLKLVASVEIGNEPASYNDILYRKMFRAMAKGVRDGDPKMKILTAAMAAGKPDDYSKAVSTVKDLQDLYDVFNIHTYSMIEGWPTWRRVYPEHPDVPYLKVIDEMIAYRNASVPGKEIWITEFGYDANSGETKPKGNWEKWVSSTETEQAQWLARSFLIFSGMDVEKAFLYYYDDQDEPSFHASSGITRKGVPKQAYYSLVHMQNTLGDYRFSKILVHDKDEVYAYEYVNPLKPKEPIVVAWRPTDDKKEMSKSFPITGTVTKAERMPLKEGPADPVSTNVNGGMVDLTLSETPTYLFLKLP